LKVLSEGQVPTTIPIKGDIIQNMSNSMSVENILRVLSVDKSLALFEELSVGSLASDVLRSRSDLTRKQYYSRMSTLHKAGLIERRSRSYSLSSLGRIVYDAQMIIGNALENYWKLVTIDSVQHLPEIGLNKIIEVLIDNPQIKESLLRHGHHTVNENDDHRVQTNNNNNNNNSITRGEEVAK
jgi:DNA-binding HxlR family transcriptional regulator